MIALMKFLAMAAGIVSLLAHIAGRAVVFAARWSSAKAYAVSRNPILESRS
jgi:hypothetical protein